MNPNRSRSTIIYVLLFAAIIILVFYSFNQSNSAQETLTSARARYDHGLASITEMADAQRLLAQAEFEGSVSKLAVWRAMLAAAKLQGDLKPFLQQASK